MPNKIKSEISQGFQWVGVDDDTGDYINKDLDDALSTKLSRTDANGFLTQLDFEVQNNTTVAVQTEAIVSTDTTSETIKTIPVATDLNDGQMAKEDVVAIRKLEQLVYAIGGGMSSYAVILPSNPSQTQLQGIYEQAAGVSPGTLAPDLTKLVDAQQQIFWQWYSGNNAWRGPFTETQQQFTNQVLGLILGEPTVEGKVYAENDGTGSVIGWTNLKTNATNHYNNTNNPHSVTKAQVGLGNVDNTSDINKPVSTAQAQAIADAIDEEDFVFYEEDNAIPDISLAPFSAVTTAGVKQNTWETNTKANANLDNVTAQNVYDKIKNLLKPANWITKILLMAEYTTAFTGTIDLANYIDDYDANGIYEVIFSARAYTAVTQSAVGVWTDRMLPTGPTNGPDNVRGMQLTLVSSNSRLDTNSMVVEASRYVYFHVSAAASNWVYLLGYRRIW